MKTRLKFSNLSFLPRSGWSELVAIPTKVGRDAKTAEATFIADDGREFRAVRCTKRADHSIYYRVYLTMNGNDTITGTLLLNEGKEQPFEFHEWVSDDPIALLPTAGVLLGGEVYDTHEWVIQPTVISDSPAHKTYFLHTRNSTIGLHLLVVATILSKDASIEYAGKIVWSDRNDPSYTKQFEAIGLTTGEMFKPDFAYRNGWPEPEKINGKWLQVMGRNIALFDGGCIPFSGRMLCFFGPNRAAPIVNWTDRSNPYVKTFEDLKAAQYGPILGCCLDWPEHSYLAGKNTARTFSGPLPVEWERFTNLLKTPATLDAPRPYGLLQIPGSTGDQEDFGHTKLTSVVVNGDPRFLYAYRYCMHGEMLRPVHHYETDGSPLSLARHPNFRTYYGYTHFDRNVSPDRLGKGDPNVQQSYPPPNPMRFENMDDQHYSINNAAAYLALTDDLLVADMFAHRMVMDEASVYVNYDFLNAARGEGRTLGGFAHYMTLIDSAHGIQSVIDRRTRLSFDSPLMGINTKDMHVDGVNPPDLRKLIYEETPQGRVYLPSVSMWEAGLALEGRYKLLKTGCITDLPKYQAIMTALCRTMAEFGCFVGSNGKKYIVADIWFNNGMRFEFDERSTKVVCSDSPGDVYIWTLVGIAIAAQYLPEGDPLKEKAILFRDHFIDVNFSTDRRIAEWFAAVNVVDRQQ